MSKTILLVESDEHLAREISDALAAHGLETLVTDDAQQAVEDARARRPDAIVLCAELPRVSGYSVCNKLRKDEALRSIPLLLTSADATPQTFEQHRRLRTHADDYLLKPYGAAELLARVAALIELPGLAEATQPEALEIAIDVAALDGAEAAGPSPAAAEPTAAPDPFDDMDLSAIDAAFDRLAAEPGLDGGDSPAAAQAGDLLGAEAASPPAQPEPGPGEPGEPWGVALEPTPGVPHGGDAAREAELEQLRTRVGGVEEELARAAAELERTRNELESARAELEQARAANEERAARDASALQQAQAAARAAEERARSAEARAGAAEQRHRRDDLVRDKTRKALTLALQLLEDPAPRAPQAEVPPRRE